MKKLVPVLAIVVVAIALWFSISSRSGDDNSQTGTTPGAANTGLDRGQPGGAAEPGEGGGAVPPRGAPGGEDEEEDEIIDERPATEIYKSADEALKAIKQAAVDYDDLVLDQFTELGPNCTWCDSFYASLKDLLNSPDTKTDQRSYYAEVLAVSGRLDNIQSLVDSVKGAKDQESADLYAEALELTLGGDDIVKYLGEQLTTTNETLREASVAAITNQGSRLAVQELYDHTRERGDADGYYSIGIGLGEVVPEPEAIPYLQELVTKRDQYSHLAVKALLNGGFEGLKAVVDLINASNNPDFDRQLLRGAEDHVNFGDDINQLLKQVSETSKSEPLKEWAKQVLADFEEAEADLEDDQDDEEFQTPLNP